MEPVREWPVTPIQQPGIDNSEQRAANGFLLALGLYFLLQLMIRVAQHGALALDEAEQVFDSQQLLLGYGSQPPLYVWLQWLVFEVFGVSHLGLAVLKNAVLFALYACVFQLARRLLGTLAGAAIAASLVLIVPLAWDAAIDRTHSLLATALAAGALRTYFALLEKPDKLRWALLGLLIGLGMQSKYNYAIFVLGLTAASLMVREHRKVIWTRDLWIAVCTAVVCLLPHAAWFIQQFDTATAETLDKMVDKDYRSGYAVHVANGFKHLFLAIASFITPLWIVLAFAYRSPHQGRLQLQAPQARFFLWLHGVGLVCIAALILSGHLAYIKSRWLQTLLFSLPLAWFVIFPPQRQVVYRRLLLVAAAAALLTLAGLSLRPQIQFALGRDSRISQPYPELASELERRFAGVRVMAVPDRWVGGDVRIQLPRIRVLLLSELCRQAPLIDGAVLVLEEPASAHKAGQGLAQCPALAVVERGQIGAQSGRRKENTLLFNYALVKRQPE
jgi:4-amino-4-deoxy-L-arabinose transferase-like glycosyltransferase